MTPREEMETLAAEQAALVWTLRSQARVGSYQHEVSSGPWHVLLAAECELESRLARASALTGYGEKVE